MHAQKVFITRNWRLLMLQIQNKLILAGLLKILLILHITWMHYKQSNKYFFLTKYNSESVCFTLMTSLTMTSFSMTRAVFVNFNIPRIVDKSISYLKLTIYRQLICWILIARHLNINKNIPRRPEVQRIGVPKSPKCDSSSTGMFKWRSLPNGNV